MKAWYQSKTLWVNIIIALLAIVSEVSQVFPVSQNPMVWTLITSVLNIILRLITGQPIGTERKS